MPDPSAQRKPTHSSGLLWSEAGVEQVGLVAEVAPLIPVFRTYAFSVPPALQDAIRPGHRVSVALGRAARATRGFVVGLSRQPWDSTLRPIEALVDPGSFLTPSLIELGRRIAAHYVCPLGVTLKAMVPESVRRERGLRCVRYARLAAASPPTAAKIAAATREKRSRVLESLAHAGGEASVRFLRAATGCSTAMLASMARDGVLELFERRQAVEPDEAAAPRTPDFELNDEQRAAFEVIRARLDQPAYSVTLLHGVSGSGKTEVYIHAIRHVLAQGRQAILLVPEIVLTTQIVARLAARFDRVAVMHSGLTQSQRSIAWRRVESGEARVVIGTRSAVFAPCHDLGLICVDEEQEDSYKNLQTPRFHVRDVALLRGHQLGIPVLVGSATPALETRHHVGSRPLDARVTLPHRVAGRPLPTVHLVDMNVEGQAVRGDIVFSRLLERKLKETLTRGEQAVILLNRRGYATRIWCPNCRQTVQCPRCSLPLVAHEAKGQAICHHCYSRIDIPRLCPIVTCGQPLVRSGLGTQKVEEALRAHFPEARLRRVDSDTMHHRDQYAQVVGAFESRQIDVLVGTQMIAKGLDFPHVSLVGVIAAETAAAMADFRNQEKLFALITQVAGRAGRAEIPGEVVVQTLLPDLPALKFARGHDYEGFATRELALRKHLGYPPFRKLARLVVSHAREETAMQAAQRLADALRQIIAASQNTAGGAPRERAADFTPRGPLPDAATSPAPSYGRGTELENGGSSASLPADLLGPAPCSRPRLRDRYRWEVLLRAVRSTDLQRILHSLQTEPRYREHTRSLTIDVDPVAFD